MALIPWKQKRDDESRQLTTTRFRNEMDRLFDSFFTGLPAWGERPWPPMSAWEPAVDVEETDKEIAVRAEMPGMKADDIDLSIHDNALIISGEKKENEERKEGGYVYQERRYGSFRRMVPLPSAVDPENVQAEYRDGVLNVTLHKSQEALPKKIKVSGK
jgi:HSP20 family protein